MHSNEQTQKATHHKTFFRSARLAASRPVITSAISAFLCFGSNAAQALTTYTSEAAWLSAVTAPPTLIGFDDLADGTAVTGVYAGQSFSAFNGGNPLAVAYSFPQAGLNMLSLGTPPLTGVGGGVAVDFNALLRGVGFWYLDSEFAGSRVTVYGTANLELGRYQLASPHPASWQFVGFTSSANDITRIEVLIDADDMVALDSLQMAAVPEPGTWAMLLVGLGLVAAAVRRRH